MRIGQSRRGAELDPIDPINQNIDAVVAMHNIAEQQIDPHQRKVESLTA